MKKIILLVAIFAFGTMSVSAQKCMVINSEKIFKSVAAYNDAVAQIERMAQEYQKNIEDAYVEVETMYNDYMNQKQYLTPTQQQQRENAILETEQNIMEYQERMFGAEGEILKKQVELIKPIQDRVFERIDNYARANRYDLVLDVANNPMVIYFNPSTDKTDAIINIVK